MFYGQCYKCGERWGLGCAPTCTCPEEGGTSLTTEELMQLFTDPENQPTQYGTVTVEYMQREIAAEREAFPRLQCVIDWLENGCDPKEAAKELRLYEAAIRARGDAK